MVSCRNICTVHIHSQTSLLLWLVICNCLFTVFLLGPGRDISKSARISQKPHAQTLRNFGTCYLCRGSAVLWRQCISLCPYVLPVFWMTCYLSRIGLMWEFGLAWLPCATDLGLLNVELLIIIHLLTDVNVIQCGLERKYEIYVTASALPWSAELIGLSSRCWV